METYTLKQLIFYLCMNQDVLCKCYLRLDCDEQTKVNILYQLHSKNFYTFVSDVYSTNDRLKSLEILLDGKRTSDYEVFGQIDYDKFMRLPKSK